MEKSILKESNVKLGSRDTIIEVKIDADAAKKHEDEKELLD